MEQPRRKRVKTEVIDLTIPPAPSLKSGSKPRSPIQAAIDASSALLAIDEPTLPLWFARVCRTVSHELGH